MAKVMKKAQKGRATADSTKYYEKKVLLMLANQIIL